MSFAHLGRRHSLLLLAALACLGCAPKGGVASPEPPPPPDPPSPPALHRTLVWSDEFNSGSAPDSARWLCEWGPNWYNGELQYYTNCRPENVRIQDGMLVLEARHEPFGGRQYTSTRLDSKLSWTYGRMEVRARLPHGGGLWPAIWMMPATSVYGGWPKSGELDIMENWSRAPDVIAGTAHTEAYNHTIGTARGGSVTVPAPYDGFHVYAIEWTPTSVTWSVDSAAYYTFQKERNDSAVWPFDKPFYFILNIAVEGSTPGQEDTWVKRTMEIDWVRVYQDK